MNWFLLVGVWHNWKANISRNHILKLTNEKTGDAIMGEKKEAMVNKKVAIALGIIVMILFSGMSYFHTLEKTSSHES